MMHMHPGLQHSSAVLQSTLLHTTAKPKPATQTNSGLLTACTHQATCVKTTKTERQHHPLGTQVAQRHSMRQCANMRCWQCHSSKQHHGRDKDTGSIFWFKHDSWQCHRRLIKLLEERFMLCSTLPHIAHRCKLLHAAPCVDNHTICLPALPTCHDKPHPHDKLVQAAACSCTRGTAALLRHHQLAEASSLGCCSCLHHGARGVAAALIGG
jgi:hypothetical protein